MHSKTYNILVVEDDFFVKTEIKRSLKQLGHHIIGDASNGREGVEKAIELSPDIILMDIGMREMNGIEATKAIQSQKPTPIIFLTAHESQDMVELATEAGASAYLTKPPRSSEIDRAIAIASARHYDLMELRKLNTALKERTVELEQAINEIKTLKEIIPICSYCKKIRNDQGYWDSIELYIYTHTGSHLSHGICPDCAPRVFKDAGLKPPTTK